MPTGAPILPVKLTSLGCGRLHLFRQAPDEAVPQRAAPEEVEVRFAPAVGCSEATRGTDVSRCETSGLACPVRIRHLFRWFSRATLGAMPLWLLRYKFTCSQAECGYHNALDAVVQADTPRTTATQVGESQHLCGRCGQRLSDFSLLKMAAPVLMSAAEKKRPVSEPGQTAFTKFAAQVETDC
jgi:hypothetical protein